MAMNQSQLYFPNTLRAKLYILSAALILALCVGCARTERTEVQSLIAEFKEINTVTCSVRKTTNSKEFSLRMMSRVHYKKGGFIHVENIAPSKRRIIADGKALYYHDATVKKGFSKPIEKLDADWSASLDTVPASPMEHLLKMLTLEQAPASEKITGGQKFTYHGDKHHIVMTLDDKHRVTSLEFFKDEELKTRYAAYTYTAFVKAGNTWLAQTHKAELTLPDGSEVNEIRQFDNLAVNATIPAKLFDHDLFMKDVEFVDDFTETWE